MTPKKQIKTVLVPPVPSFDGDMSFKTVNPGEINVTWDSDTQYFTSFNLFLNNENFLNTTNKCKQVSFFQNNYRTISQ